MNDQRPDVSRLFQHFGLDPSGYLQFPNQALAGGGASPASSEHGTTCARTRISDPVLRSARLRAELLQGAVG